MTSTATETKFSEQLFFDFENLALSTKTLSSQRDTLPIIGVFLLPSASSGTIRRNRAISQRWGGGYASSPKPLPSAGVRRRGDIAPRPDARRPGPVYPQHERFGRLLLNRMGALRDLPALKALSQAAAQPATPAGEGHPVPPCRGPAGLASDLAEWSALPGWCVSRGRAISPECGAGACGCGELPVPAAAPEVQQ